MNFLDNKISHHPVVTIPALYSKRFQVQILAQRLRFPAVFINLSRKMPVEYLKLCHDHFLPDPF
jgi:hypothetical protein